jgi:DNA (cytosine-5)-methyltransferase 1
MALGDDFQVVRTIVDSLEEAGYRIQLGFVDAWRYGAPQHRKRLIMLVRPDSDEFPWPAPPRRADLRAAIHDLPRLGEGTGGREIAHSKTFEGLSDFAMRLRKGADVDRVHDHMTRPVRDDDREIFGLMTHRTLYADIDERLRRYKADTFDDKYKRLDGYW